MSPHINNQGLKVPEQEPYIYKITNPSYPISLMKLLLTNSPATA